MKSGIKWNKIVIIAIFLSLCLVFFGCPIIGLVVYSDIFGRVEGSRDSAFYSWLESYPREETYFYSGKNRLQGFVYGMSNSKGLIIVSHGLRGVADDYYQIIGKFVDDGWRVFAFNNTGVDGSEGESMRGLSQAVIDLDAALTYVKNISSFNGLPIMLLGHSWGSYAVCAVLNYNHIVNAVVCFAGFNSTQEVMTDQGITSAGGIYYIVSPQVWAIEKQLFGDTAKLTAIDGINKSLVPVMILQGSDDTITPPNKVSIYADREKINNPNVEIIYLKGFGHSFVFYPNDGLMEQVNNFLNSSK